MKKIPLTQGQFALVDDADFEWVNQWKWCAYRTPRKNFRAARTTRNPRKTVYLHCELLGIKGVDHKSGDSLDNRRENLRPATSKQNHRAFKRKRIGATSQYRGVSWCSRDRKWIAQIVKSHIGSFDTEVDAALAYDKAAKKLGFFKEALNFSNE